MQAQIAAMFRRLTQGVYVIGVGDGNHVNAFTAAWVMQVSFNPPLLALSISPEHKSYALLQAGRGFVVNVLGAAQIDLAAHFGQPRVRDKLTTVSWHKSDGGYPVLDAVPAWLECRVVSETAAGDHQVVIGRVKAGAVCDEAAGLLTYADTGSLDDSVQLYPHDL